MTDTEGRIIAIKQTTSRSDPQTPWARQEEQPYNRYTPRHPSTEPEQR
jgi:hypothetical protein